MSEVKEFVNKIEEKGYTTRIEQIHTYQDRIVISKDNYYHVALALPQVLDASFEHTLCYIENEIDKLKQRKGV